VCIINAISLSIGVDKNRNLSNKNNSKKLIINNNETIFIYTNMFNKLSLVMALNERYPNA
jgi:hypothetical protein